MVPDASDPDDGERDETGDERADGQDSVWKWLGKMAVGYQTAQTINDAGDDDAKQ